MLKTFIKNTSFGISLLLIALSALLAVIILPIFGKQTFIVKTGSMSPVIKPGDLIVTLPRSNSVSHKSAYTPIYKAGDIIAFRDLKTPTTIITHRIVGIQTINNQTFYKTKGDANNTADIDLVPRANVIGQGVMVFLYLGKLFAFARSRQGFPYMVIFPSLVVIFGELINICREIINSKQRKNYVKRYIYKRTRPRFKLKLFKLNEL